MNDALLFWLHDNWLPGLMVLALGAVLLRLVLIARRGRKWRDLGRDVGKGATAAGGIAAAAAIGVAGPESAPAAEPAGKGPADDGGPSGSGGDGGNAT